jgi:hypothetical protein
MVGEKFSQRQVKGVRNKRRQRMDLIFSVGVWIATVGIWFKKPLKVTFVLARQLVIEIPVSVSGLQQGIEPMRTHVSVSLLSRPQHPRVYVAEYNMITNKQTPPSEQSSCL